MMAARAAARDRCGPIKKVAAASREKPKRTSAMQAPMSEPIRFHTPEPDPPGPPPAKEPPSPHPEPEREPPAPPMPPIGDPPYPPDIPQAAPRLGVSSAR
jgi:hypothetical protein